MSCANPMSAPVLPDGLAQRLQVLRRRLGRPREPAVRRDVDADDLGAEGLEQPRPDDRAGAVAGVEHDLRPSPARWQRPDGLEHRRQVLVQRVRQRLDRADPLAPRLRVLALVVDVEQFAPARTAQEQRVGTDELQRVPLGRVVAGRDRDAARARAACAPAAARSASGRRRRRRCGSRTTAGPTPPPAAPSRPRCACRGRRPPGPTRCRCRRPARTGSAGPGVRESPMTPRTPEMLIFSVGMARIQPSPAPSSGFSRQFQSRQSDHA